MHITMVKKPTDPTSTCRKCDEVLERLDSLNLMSQIDRVLTMEANPSTPCEGSQLAARLQITRAPFFLVEHNNGEEKVYMSVMKLIRQVLRPAKQSTTRTRPSLTSQ